MTKLKTDREMLQACYRAMLEADGAATRGIPTRWTDFVLDLSKHLEQAEPPAARTCRCDSAKADKCSGGDMMLICRCDCHQVNRT